VNTHQQTEKRLKSKIEEWNIALRSRDVERLEQLEAEIWRLADELGVSNPWSVKNSGKIRGSYLHSV